MADSKNDDGGKIFKIEDEAIITDPKSVLTKAIIDERGGKAKRIGGRKIIFKLVDNLTLVLLG